MRPIDPSPLARQGFVVAPDVAPEALLAPARAAVVDWAQHPLTGGVVPVHHGQVLWDLRQHPDVHAVFAELLGTGELWVTMDRAIHRGPGVDDGVLHWDADPRTARGLQGMLFLTDAPAGHGPFECVPSLFADRLGWLARHPHLDLEAPIDLEGHPPVEVPARAGDLVVWDVRLPHRGGRNDGPSPRLSVPIAMHPVGSDDERAERIRCWEERRAPVWWRGWPGQVDPEPGPPATLTALGRKLVGLDRW